MLITNDYANNIRVTSFVVNSASRDYENQINDIAKYLRTIHLESPILYSGSTEEEIQKKFESSVILRKNKEMQELVRNTLNERKNVRLINISILYLG